MLTKKFFYTLTYPIALIALCVLYFSHAPATVQTGDSGELAAAAFKLLVPHPPGYPLWVWIHHLWLQLAPSESVFYFLSILNSVIALGSLVFLGALIPSQSARVLAVISLGLSPIFWRYSEIPEVFALNTFLALAVVYTGMSKRTFGPYGTPVSSAIMPIIFSLGIAHHHTIVFMLPFVLYICWNHRKEKILYSSIAMGFVICCSLYLSLQLFNPSFIYSWNSIDSMRAVWNHFLRTDYGTFILQAQHRYNDTATIIFFYIKHLLISTWPLLAIAAVIGLIRFHRNQKLSWEPAWTALFLCIFLYSVVFIPLTNTQPINFMIDVLERFIILPIALTITLLGLFISKNTMSNSRFSICGYAAAAAIGISSFLLYSPSNNFSKNTIVEDYAYNLLENAGNFKNPLLVITGDTELFATRYLQVVEGIQPKILVGSKHSFKVGWFILKAKEFSPGLSLDYEKITREKVLFVVEDFIQPNADTFSIITDDDEYPADQLHISVLPIGFLLQKGTGLDVQLSDYRIRTSSDGSIIATPLNDFSYFRVLLTKYTYYYTFQGIQAAKKGNAQQSIGFFETALQIAPFAIPPLENLCKLKKEMNISDGRCDEIETHRKYFDYYKFNNKRGT